MLKPAAWRVVRNRAPFAAPEPADLLATVMATDRAEASRTASRLFPTESVVVVPASTWPLETPVRTPVTGDGTSEKTAAETAAARMVRNRAPYRVKPGWIPRQAPARKTAGKTGNNPARENASKNASLPIEPRARGGEQETASEPGREEVDGQENLKKPDIARAMEPGREGTAA